MGAELSRYRWNPDAAGVVDDRLRLASSHGQIIACTNEKNAPVADAKQVHEQLHQKVRLRQSLVAEIPVTTKSQIEARNPELLKITPVMLPARMAPDMKNARPLSRRGRLVALYLASATAF